MDNELLEENKTWQEGYELLLKEHWKLKAELEIYKKALDKAIEVINKTNTKLTEKELVKNFGNWKEFLLKESEKE